MYLLETRGDFIQGINWVRTMLRVLPLVLRLMADAAS